MKVNIAKKAFLVSLSIHLLVFIVLYLLPHKRIKEEDMNKATLEVDIVESKALQPVPSAKLKPTLLDARQERLIYKKVSTPAKHPESDSKIDEVLQTAPIKLTKSATKSRDFPKTDIMPKIDTAAKLKDLSDSSIPATLSTPTDISPAKGVKSTRQVVAGKGSGGLGDGGGSMVNSHGASDGISIDKIDFDITNKKESIDLTTGWKIRDGLAAIADKIIEVNQVDQASGSKEVDVVFLLDASGSMKNIIKNVLQYIDFFIRNLESKKIDYALALVSFAEQGLETDISAFGVTLDVNAFKGWLGGIAAYGGGDVPEPGLDAIMAGLQDISFRSGANKVFVLYTDAPFHPKDKYGNDVKEILNILRNNAVTVHAFSIKDPRLQKLASETGGTWSEIPEEIRLASGKGYNQKDRVKFLPELDPDLEFLRQEKNKRLGLTGRDPLFSLESYAYDGDQKHKPKKLAGLILGMISCLGYKVEDNFPDNNNNSIAEPGEKIKLNIILKNTVGNLDVEDVKAELELENAEDSEVVKILSGRGNYGTITAGKIASKSDYQFKIAPDFKGKDIKFRLKIKGLVYSTNYDLGSKTITIYVKQ